MKRIWMKIFISVLIAGIIGIVGVVFLNYDIDMLLQSYNEISEKHMVNRNYINEINRQLYEHQAAVANFSAASDPAYREKIQNKEKEIRNSMQTLFEQFSVRMHGDQREQYFHKAYSNYQSYLKSTDIAINFSIEGDADMSSYYAVSVLDSFIDKINGNFEKLDSFIIEEMQDAKDRMDVYINISEISKTISIILIVLAMVICIIYCTRLARALDNYKEDLEEEIDIRNEAIRLHTEKMLSLQNNIIIAMANLIESRDGDTGGHVKRTSKYVSMLAKKAQEKGMYKEVLTDSYIELLVKAAPMHDVGKISVPDSILQKPGKLTSEEYDRMKCHAADGGRIIRKVMENLEDLEYVDIASDVAHYHHEKWNGTGYPDGLAGESIPLCARIMALADVFDALVSKRCYKKAMDFDEAFDIIKESSGSHFDPTLAELFLEMRKDIEEVAKEYGED